MIEIHVLGTPAPKGNARAFVNKATGRAVISTFGSGDREKRVRGWDASVREAAMLAVRAFIGDCAIAPMFVDKPLAVRLVFRIARPMGHWGKGKNAGKLVPAAPSVPRSKPDADKLARSTLDALHGTVFDDDARIVELVVHKIYALPGLEGAHILVEEWKAP